MKYRREIDGLRAVAVLPVIFFHADIRGFSGGFVGVDVFFVISGYLITTLILAEKQNDVFTLIGFYERRIRRILPALLLVMLICLPFAWLWMPQNEMKDFSESLIAIFIFSSNILFWKKSGYFATATELNPLIHTWSLSVEEQYYLLFPIFLIMTWRLGKRCVVCIFTVMLIASLAGAQWGSYHRPTSTFFLLPTRGWELLIGTLLAFYLSNNVNKKIVIKTRGQSILALVGIFLIFYAVLMFDKDTPFPSLFTLIPTLGAALVILFATPSTLVGKLLSSKPFVGVGLISYSAYLWHQPLFAFARLYSVEVVSSSIFLVLSVLSLVFAYLSWRYVELPFRTKIKMETKYVMVIVFFVSGIIVSLGLYGDIKNGFVMGGFADRLLKEQKRIASYVQYDYQHAYREGICFLNPEQSYKDFSIICKKVIPNKNTILIWGDSHAAALAAGFRHIMPNVVQYTASACPPILDLPVKIRPHCKDINDFILREVAQIKPKIIILHADWTNWSNYHMQNPALAVLNTVRRIFSVAPSSKVYIVGSITHWPQALPMYLISKGVKLNKGMYMYTPMLGNLETVDNQLRAVATANGITFLSALDMLCKKDACQSVFEFNGVLEPTAWDSSHLTQAGSFLLASKILTKIEKM